MKTRDFDYHLPQDRIAQTPVRPRDSSRLLVLDRATGETRHRRFFELGEELREDDLLVTNNSKVFRARLKTDDGREVFLLRPEDDTWRALLKPGKKFAPGDIVRLSGEDIEIVSKDADGAATVRFHMPPDRVIAFADRVGEVPIPPYIEAPLGNDDEYQTVYASQVGSVAAPTAGFHFTPELLESLTRKGIRFAEVTLHVGLGTFRPVKSETLDAHTMHEEWIDVPESTRKAIRETRERGGRVIAVGTTTVRALESGITHGLTNIFITPGHRFSSVDGIITNFHLPKSTLLVLVSAFAGRERVLAAYEEAIREGYRFYSFGDAMLSL